MDAKVFIESLQMIKALYKDNTVVHTFLDNAGYHKNKEVEEYMAQAPQDLPIVQLHYCYRKVMENNT